MIVKTAANYQAEGGYIEASNTGGVVSITTSGVNDFIIGGVENDPPGFVEIELINNTDRALFVTCLTNIGNVIGLSTPLSANVPANATTKVKIPAFVNIPLRCAYGGASASIKIQSEYLKFVESGNASRLSIKKLPTDGSSITGTFYI